jgi:hypothetical protein
MNCEVFTIINAKQLEHEANLEIVDSQRLCMSDPQNFAMQSMKVNFLI